MSWLWYEIEAGYAVGHFENGKTVLFDIDNLPEVSKHKWFVDASGYATSCLDGKNIRMHRFLVDVPDGKVIDHINRDKLDNRRGNLRICTQKENCQNMSMKSNNKSGVTGVYYDKRAKRWRAQIYIKQKAVHVGIFDDFEDAVAARNEAVERFRKEAECVASVT